MPDHKALSPDDLTRLHKQIAADFDAIASSSPPIRAQLLHRATNAERQGVVGTPHSGAGVASICTIGNRDFRPLKDADGRPLPADPPIVDFEGRTFDDGNGNPVMVEFPASRTLRLFGDPACVSRLQAIADRAGAILRQSPPIPNAGLSGWRPSDDGGYWWLHLFELAIGGQLPLVECRRQLWNGNASFPYDLDQLRQLSQCSPAKGRIPEAWMTELPDAWYAELPDAVHACRELDNYVAAARLLAELATGPAPNAENGDGWYPASYYSKNFYISDDRLRQAALKKRIRKCKRNGNRNYYRIDDVRKLWPGMLPSGNPHGTNRD